MAHGNKVSKSELKRRGSTLSKRSTCERESINPPIPLESSVDRLLLPPNPTKWHLSFYNDFIPTMSPLGLLSEADSIVLGALCESWVVWQVVSAELFSDPELVLSKTLIPCERGSNTMESSLSRVVRANRIEFYKLAKEFGLTPASRKTYETKNTKETLSTDIDCIT